MNTRVLNKDTLNVYIDFTLEMAMEPHSSKDKYLNTSSILSFLFIEIINIRLANAFNNIFEARVLY